MIITDYFHFDYYLTPEQIYEQYPTPADLITALFTGDIKYDQLPDQIKLEVDYVLTQSPTSIYGQ